MTRTIALRKSLWHAKPRRFCVLASAVFGGLLLAHLAYGRDGVSGCNVGKVGQASDDIWRYTVELRTPQAGHCRVYISEDRDRKSWVYCGLALALDNPVSITCDDAIDDPDFVDWKARAVCGGQSFMAYCRQEK